MKDEERRIYNEIMQGGYGNIKADGLQIFGNIEILKNIIVTAITSPRKTREEHLAEIGLDDGDDKDIP